VEWTGALAEHLFAPLLTSGAELARRPAAAGLARGVAQEARRLLSGAPGPAVIAVGGPGAVWPFAADALAALGLGPVWGSGEPELDLALGACWWPQLRRALAAAPAGRPAPLARPDGPPAVAGPAVTGSAVTGSAVAGPAVAGPAVTGTAVAGPAVAGTAVAGTVVPRSVVAGSAGPGSVVTGPAGTTTAGAGPEQLPEPLPEPLAEPLPEPLPDPSEIPPWER
jgi:hypothetical protein